MKTTIELAEEAGIDFQEHIGILGKRTVTTCGSQPVERIERFAALLRAEWEAERVQQEPVASQSRFVGYEWTECSIEHARMVLESPQEWTDYEVRLLYTAPPAQPQQADLSDKQLQMINFLYGSGEWKGYWFGDHNPDAYGANWWRKDLRELFQAPPAQPAAQPQPLTDEQIDAVIEKHAGGLEWSDDEYESAVSFFRAIEAAHNIRSKE